MDVKRDSADAYSKTDTSSKTQSLNAIDRLMRPRQGSRWQAGACCLLLFSAAALFFTKDGEGIDAGGAEGGDEAGAEGDEDEEHGYGEEGGEVAGAYSV